jgi:AcrR family transcriptional regulator
MTPRTADQNRALRDASRERLLAAAIRLFARQGYASTPVRAIAEEAGVAQGLLYSHFRGKEDLLRALFRRSMEDVRESFAAAREVRTPGGTPLERLARSAAAILRRNLDFWRLSYGVRMQQGVAEALGPELKAWTRDILAVLEGHFRAAGSRRPSVDAALFFAALDGVCQHFALDPEGYPLDPVIDALVALFEAGGSCAPAPAPETPPTPPRGDRHGKPRCRA